MGDQEAVVNVSVGSFVPELHYLSLIVRKSVFGVSDQLRNKHSCTTTEDEISDLESRGIVVSM